MVHHDLKGFIAAAVYDDAELNQPSPEEELSVSQLPRWARNRARFSKRQMAYISPRLGLLNNLPMTVPFMTRLEIFRNFIEMDNERLRNAGLFKHRLKAKIRRDHLAQDGFDQLGDMGPELKGHIYIKFYDQYAFPTDRHSLAHEQVR
jgi:ubiquitin-protein ligase E3 C